ncbi:gamma-glutamyl-gamma-aminobutyrate hydrolase family protein [Halioxenophilus aromaticivorans]|uniref:gamma-glutamyl-gamma-aminobutyrate hydrolase n=1 Tax=Halioxenophilus aromaticivorans TaxID=1306992 RepID=A0AAV3U0M9_9ALTE
MVATVGFPACRKLIAPHYFHCVGEKYIHAVVDVVGAVPLLLPAVSESKGHRISHNDLLDNIDGLLLTGAYSNVQSSLYGEPLAYEGSEADPARDHLTQDLIRQAVSRGIPVLGICRGIQEVNVAFGGSLHQQVHAVPGLQDHRENNTQPLDQQYGFSHSIAIQPGGVLARIWQEEQTQVNSLHGQGIKSLAPGLSVEAVAPDGLVEAVSLPGKPLLAVQWHPEWKVTETPFYLAIFEWFKSEIDQYRAARLV